MKRSYLQTAIKAALLIPTTATMVSMPLMAQESNEGVETIEVRGLVSSLKRAMSDKKESILVSDGIAAEDLGKFPDLNVAESLQRITGVSIDRSGGEGQAVTVRGFGPQFNTVLVNGRQIATDSGGREFNFDVLAADQITGADIYKSTRADLQEGGIGSTINVSTARPFDNNGLQIVGSVKGMYETLSEEISPQASILVSNTFDEDRMGILFALSHQKRDVQINRIQTAGWRPGITLKNRNQDIVASDVYIPRNWDQIVDTQQRTRTNASLVFQLAPTDTLGITFDGFISKFEVDAEAKDLASWFEPSRVGSATIDPETRTAVAFTQELGIFTDGVGEPRTDFVSHTQNSRDTTVDGFGINVEWAIADNLTGTFDLSMSSAENDQAGKNRFNVIGLDNNYSFNANNGSPVVEHDGFEGGSLPSASLARAHYNDRDGFTDKDEITEFKADFAYESDSDVFRKANFGVYRQQREKSRVHKNTTIGCSIFCGYNVDVPDELLSSFTANNYFSGLIDTFYTYDGEAYFDYLESDAGLAAGDVAQELIRQQNIADGVEGTSTDPILPGFSRNALTTDDGIFGHVPQVVNDGYVIEEDITSFYMNFDFSADIGDMPVYVNFGARYSQTNVDVTAVQSNLTDIIPTPDATLFQNVLSAPTTFSQGGSYASLLPSLNVKLEIQDDMVLRFAVYDSLTRPTLSQMSPATIYGQPRSQNLTAVGGNPALEPFKSENWDVSYEWYFGDASSFSFAYFSKDVQDFIITLSGPETIALNDRLNTSNNICGECNASTSAEELIGATEIFNVTRPRNGEAATVTGFEIALTHVWESGFGFTANATIVDSNATLGADTTQSFALEGLGDSQNLIGFYENDGFQARIAFNNREGFLRALDNGSTGEPINGTTFGQWDISASYDIDDHFSIFIEGINVTEEEQVQTGRFANQIYSIEDNGSRYAIGVRASF